MRTCKFRQLIFGTALLLFACSLAWGQAFTSGSIVGTVADSSGAIIPRVSLTLTNLGTTAKLTTESDNTGLYQFLNLPPGNYRVDAEKSGFVHFVQEPVHVLVNSSGRIDITLQVGDVNVVGTRELHNGDELVVGQTLLRFSTKRKQASYDGYSERRPS